MFKLICHNALYNVVEQKPFTTSFSYSTLAETAEHLSACLKFEMFPVKTKKNSEKETTKSKTWYEIKTNDEVILTIDENKKIKTTSENIISQIIPHLHNDVVEEYFSEYLK